MGKQQTAVEWLEEKLRVEFGFVFSDNIFEQAKEMEKEQSHKYAEFAIKCDRIDMEILNFNDYINLINNKNK